MEEEATSSSSLKTEFDSIVNVKYTTEEDRVEEEPVPAHRLVLSTFSPLLNELLQKTSSEKITSISLDLSAFKNGLAAFKVMLEALYTGEIKLTEGVTANEVLEVTHHCQVTGLDAKIASTASMHPLNLSTLLNSQHADQNVFSSSMPPLQYPQPQLQNYLSLITNMWTNPLFSAFFANCGNNNPSPNLSNLSSLSFLSQSDTENSRTQSEGSSPRANQTPPTTDLEKIVPNDDKEGWCRNKKYIEKVDGGFMCTVCRKIYGRYNSVSYHVTIYHRNPPIKCEENGCNFSTREARYIHFHKYYRHHIPLPENIDLGSRKCPFCRHVSKSPAMLEKHIARHETDGSSPGGTLKRAQSKKRIAPSTSTNLPDILNATSLFGTPPVTAQPLQCSLCSFHTYGTELLFLHLATMHTAEFAQTAITDNLSETSAASTSSSSDGEPTNDIEIDVKPMIDMKPLVDQALL